MKRAILKLVERIGYRIVKNAEYGRFEGQVAEIATLKERLMQEEAKSLELDRTTAELEEARSLQLDRTTAELASLKVELAEQEAKTHARDRELERERVHLRRAQHEIAETRMQARSATFPFDRELTRGRPFYIAHTPHHHDRLYAENLGEFFAELGISTTTILLDPDSGQNPQLVECLLGDALGVIGFNSQLDHSWIGDSPFLQVALEQQVPVIQWILDHPSSRLAEFTNSSSANSRFLFSSRNAEEYFRRFGIQNALTATVNCVGPSRHSRAKNLNFRDFSNRPIVGIVAMNLARIGGTIEDAWQRVCDLDPRLRTAVEETIERSRLDLIEPLEAHFERALTRSGMEIANAARHSCVQMVEEIVQIERRQKIFEVARAFPLLIQSDSASRPFQLGSKATFKENQEVAVTWARLKRARAHVCISNMHDMVHDRILNGLNAGCANIVEDNHANRCVFEHGRDALFFRYDDDSLRECLELVCHDLERCYDIAANGFGRRDDSSFRFGDFSSILNLARQPFPDSC